MENYFYYYKGYKNAKNQKDIHPLIVLAVIALLLVTILAGLMGIFVSIGKGRGFSETFQIAPVLVVMTFVAILLFVPSLLFYIYLLKWNKEKKNWKNVTIYLDDKEELSVLAKYEEEVLYLKTWKTIAIPKDKIKEIIISDPLKMIITLEKEYYILFKESDFNQLNLYM